MILDQLIWIINSFRVLSLTNLVLLHRFECILQKELKFIGVALSFCAQRNEISWSIQFRSWRVFLMMLKLFFVLMAYTVTLLKQFLIHFRFWVSLMIVFVESLIILKFYFFRWYCILKLNFISCICEEFDNVISGLISSFKLF